MTGSNRGGGAKVGDYVLERALPARPHELAFRAIHELIPRRVRLVMLHPTAGSRETATQMLHDACLVETLRHPGIPRLYECGHLPDGRPWQAYERVTGPTLAELCGDRVLPAGEVIVLLREVGSVLAHAHGRGIAHAGLRPGAITWSADGLVLGEWSAARSDADHPRDLYALGAIAYQALTRTLPAGPLRRHCPSVPDALASLVDRMLAAAPTARPSAAEVQAQATRRNARSTSPPIPGSRTWCWSTSRVIRQPRAGRHRSGPRALPARSRSRTNPAVRAECYRRCAWNRGNSRWRSRECEASDVRVLWVRADRVVRIWLACMVAARARSSAGGAAAGGDA